MTPIEKALLGLDVLVILALYAFIEIAVHLRRRLDRQCGIEDR